MQNKNTNVRRVKILLLGYNDNELEGHVFLIIKISLKISLKNGW